ncbi:hypothetical protein JCM3770_000800 [Rhodotorula araucariae]
MGHVHSRPSTSSETPASRRSKGKAIPRTSFLDLSFSASAWSSPTGRFGSRSRTRRRAAAGAEGAAEQARQQQREELQRFLAETIENQREAERLLAQAHLEGHRPSAMPRLVLGDCGPVDGALDGLMIAVNGAEQPFGGGAFQSSAATMARTRSAGGAVVNLTRPLRRRRPSFDLRELQSAQSTTPGMSPSTSTTPSSLSYVPPSPTASDAARNKRTPPMSFTSFRNSLNHAQLDRLSVLLADPDKLDDADIAVASEVLSGRTLSRRQPSAHPSSRRGSQASRARKSNVQSQATPRMARSSSAESVGEVWSSEIPFPVTRAQRRSLGTVDGQPLSPRFSTTPATLSQLQRAGSGGPGQHAPWIYVEAEPQSPRMRGHHPSVMDGLSDYIAASPQLAFPGEVPPGSPASNARARAAPPSSPASGHSRARLDRRAVPPRPPRPRLTLHTSSSSSISTHTRSNRSPFPCRPTHLGAAAAATGADVPLCLTAGAVSRLAPLDLAGSGARSVAMSASGSGTSFPQSVAHDDGFSFASPSPLPSPGVSAASRHDAPLPRPPPDATLFPPAVDWSWSGSSSFLAPPAPASSRPSSVAESDFALGHTLDAFPAPPQTKPTSAGSPVLRSAAAARHSILSASDASTEMQDRHTAADGSADDDGMLRRRSAILRGSASGSSDSSASASASASAVSSEATSRSAASIEPLPASAASAAPPSRTVVDFGAATARRRHAATAAGGKRDSGSGSVSSLGTVVDLSDLVDELVLASALGLGLGLGLGPGPGLDAQPVCSPVAVAATRDAEDAPGLTGPVPPPVPPKEPSSLAPPPSPSPSPSPPPPSATEAGRGRQRLGCRHKRGFSPAEIGEWLACAGGERA